MTLVIKLSSAWWELAHLFSLCLFCCSCLFSKNSQSSVVYERRWIVWDSNINGGCDLHGLLQLVPNQSTAPPLWPSCSFLLLLSLSCQSQFITLSPVSPLPKKLLRSLTFSSGIIKKKFVFEHFREERILWKWIGLSKEVCPETLSSVALMHYSCSGWTFAGFALVLSL